MRLTEIKRKTKKALAASARTNYDQKFKENKANTCVGNFLQKTLSKNLYYTSKIDECQKDADKVWNVIRFTLPNSKLIKDTPDSLVTDRGTISDYQNVADKFNNFFCSIGSNLANNFSNTSFKSFSTYLNKQVSSSIYLNIPNPTEIFNAIYSIKNNKDVGHDEIPAFFFPIASSVITYFVSLSFY